VKIDGTTRLFGIIGNPVSHSLSPVMHNAAFTAVGLNSVYLPFQVKNVEGALGGLRHLNIGGVSVTIPHKEAVLPFLDSIDKVARKIGSVNTIHCKKEGDETRLIGYNTDWIGANRALQGQMELEGASVVIIGAGGSARAIGFGLIEAGAEITLCSRTEKRGRDLAYDLQCDWFPLDGISQLEGSALVNATSVGMVPHGDKSPVAAEATACFDVVMDIVYAPLQTLLLRDGKKNGCRVINGLEMLLYQGVAQFELWTGLQAPVEEMRRALFTAVRAS